MLSHIVLFRDYIFGQRRKPRDKARHPLSAPEWAAFNRALYQRPQKFHYRTP